MCGFQEMDSIVDQMMTVAEYIGWETKELRPVRNVYLIYIVLIYTVKIIHIYIFKFVYIWLYISDTSRNDVRNRLRLWRHCFFRGMETWWNDYHSTSCTSWPRHGKERNLACINSTFAIYITVHIDSEKFSCRIKEEHNSIIVCYIIVHANWKAYKISLIDITSNHYMLYHISHMQGK